MATSSIISLLKKDHQEVSSLLKEALATTERAHDKRTTLFTKITAALAAHMRFEEENIYPILLDQRDSKDDALEAEEEHAQIKRLVADISATDVTDERWKAKLTVLAEDIHHHVKEEESPGGLFDEVKKKVDDDELAELADHYEAEKAANVS
ncbi:MAG TPA: hemerythrin domain-containing protein [Planctomycetota bacterium]|nr:hemerythrin domain-containing protein [Planctomycetota bacterium]